MANILSDTLRFDGIITMLRLKFFKISAICIQLTRCIPAYKPFQNILRKEKTAQEMAEKIAKEKHVKRMNFLLDILKAVIGGVVVLLIEHFSEIALFVKNIFQE